MNFLVFPLFVSMKFVYNIGADNNRHYAEQRCLSTKVTKKYRNLGVLRVLGGEKVFRTSLEFRLKM